MQNLIEITQTIFKKQFGYDAKHIVQAPGRVNLIGEHTDYNDGFVMPCAINYNTVISSAKRDDQIVRVIAVDYDQQQDSFSLDNPIEKHASLGWANYVRGVVKHMKDRLHHVGGMDLVISGNVPLGAGLSSSASLEVCIATTIKTLYDLPVDSKKLALICQEAENKFVGCNCGIMDQFISTMGQKDHALLIDCRSLETKSIPIPAGTAVAIINSNVRHGLVGSEYNMRRQQCEEAAKIMGVKKLRDATLSMLDMAKEKMDPVVYKRAHHVITENERTLRAVSCLEKNDLATLGELMEQSHNSLRDNFEVTVPPVDTLVEIVKAQIGNAGGVRMTGGGFGGCVVALIPEEKVELVRKAVEAQYQQKTGLKESFYICTASDGAKKLS